ncbi:ethylene-responsive transcription factor ERF117 [Lathyrus oleraceus]|uniref:ethylene-responsive transcription factor ERF117 n=1 Tax=Pisum sativum TaxID=3888 RepID=UPI0021CE1442|nr:ethylene-responsive transcription factor ERF117-like [Pisum sativum]
MVLKMVKKKNSIQKKEKVKVKVKKQNRSTITNPKKVEIIDGVKLYLKDSGQQLTSTSKYKCVRLRRRKYSDEIQDPFVKKRIWLGTFDTEIQATKAYSRKMDEYEEKKLAEITSYKEDVKSRNNYDNLKTMSMKKRS